MNSMVATAGRALDERDAASLRYGAAVDALREEFLAALRSGDVAAELRAPAYSSGRQMLCECFIEGLTRQEQWEVTRLLRAVARGEVTDEMRLHADALFAAAAKDHAELHADLIAGEMGDEE